MIKKLCFVLLGAVFLFFLTAEADKEIKAGDRVLAYNPPQKNAEKRRRIGGAAISSHRGLTRGLGESVSLNMMLKKGLGKSGSTTSGNRSMPSYLAPLGPEDIGYTATDSPVLYFYVSPGWDDTITFTLNKEGDGIPVLKTAVQGIPDGGLVKIDLAAAGIALEPGVEYEWFVAITLDNPGSSSNIAGSAVVKYVKPSYRLSSLLKNTPEQELYYLYAREGYFYNAVANLGLLIQDKGKKELRLQRAILMDHVDLGFVAQYDRKL